MSFMSDDDTGHLEEHKIDRQLRKGGDGGARISMEDSRVTWAANIIQPIITGGVLAGIIYFANQVGALRDAVMDTNKQIALSNQQNQRMTEDIRDHEGRIRVLEGRNLRGEQEAIVLPSERRRGN